MKKTLFLILACAVPALAEINVTPGSGARVVRTVTSGGQEVQGVFLTDGISSVTITGISLNTFLQNVVVVDSSVYNQTVSSVVPVGGIYTQNPVIISTYAVGAFRMGRFRNQYVTLMDDNNVMLGTSTANAMFVTNGGITQPVVLISSGGPGNPLFVSILSSGSALNPFYTEEVGTVQLSSATLSVVIVSSGSSGNPLYVSVLSSGSSTNPWFVYQPTAIQLASATINAVIVSSGGPGNPLFVSVLSSGSAPNPWFVYQPVAVQLSSGTTTNPLQVNVLNNSSVTFNGVPQPVWSSMTFVAGGVVSSTTFTSPLAQNTSGSILIDSQNRIITADIPLELTVSTYNSVLGGDVVEHVLISSAAAGQRIRMCGCIFMNTSATNTGYTLYVSTSNNTGRNFAATGGNPIGVAYPIGVPANYLPTGVRPDCGHPFMAGIIGGQITYKASATQTAAMQCTYYTQ